MLEHKSNTSISRRTFLTVSGMLAAFSLQRDFLNSSTDNLDHPPSDDPRYDLLVDIARGELAKGVDEANSDDPDNGKFGKRYIHETYNTASMDASWCNYFALWCAKQANGGRDPVSVGFDYEQFNALPTPDWEPAYRFTRSTQLVAVQYGACFANEAESRARIRPGFFITYKWTYDKPPLRWDDDAIEAVSAYAHPWPNHIGIVENIDFAQNCYDVIEGNEIGVFRGTPTPEGVDRMGKIRRMRIPFDDPTINSFIDPFPSPDYF